MFFMAILAGRAQNRDKVVTASGDTISCEISHRFPSTGVKYRKAKHEKAINITTDSVKGYYMANESTWYRRVYYDDKGLLGGKVRPSFMSVVESGKINLYQMIITTTTYGGIGMTYSNSNTEWFVSKGSDTGVMVKGALFGRQKRKNEFSDLLTDNQGVYNRYLADDKFSFDEIRNLVCLYNTGKPYVDPNSVRQTDSDFDPNKQ